SDHVYGAVPPVAADVCEYATVTSPAANAFVVMDGAPPIVIDSALVADAPTLAGTFSVKLKGPAAVGVPVIAPLLAKLNPPGNGPGDNVQLYGCVPPLAAAVCEYPTPTAPPARALVVIAGASPIVMASALVAVAPTLSVTFSVKLKVPAAVGVPVIAPLLARLNPQGNGPGDSVQV